MASSPGLSSPRAIQPNEAKHSSQGGHAGKGYPAQSRKGSQAWSWAPGCCPPQWRALHLHAKGKALEAGLVVMFQSLSSAQLSSGGMKIGSSRKQLILHPCSTNSSRSCSLQPEGPSGEVAGGEWKSSALLYGHPSSQPGGHTPPRDLELLESENTFSPSLCGNCQVNAHKPQAQPTSPHTGSPAHS